MFMNKKVLTLCAGFLLAGSLNAFAASSIVIPIGEKAKELKSDKAYFFVNDRSDVDGTLDYVYGHEDIEGKEGHVKELLYSGTGTINEEDISKKTGTVITNSWKPLPNSFINAIKCTQDHDIIF